MNPIEWYFGLWEKYPIIAILFTILLVIFLVILFIIIAFALGIFVGLTDWASNLFRR